MRVKQEGKVALWEAMGSSYLGYLVHHYVIQSDKNRAMVLEASAYSWGNETYRTVFL